METFKIDKSDVLILREIARDGRISVQALSEAVGLSPTPVARRLKKLEETGIVTGYTALIDEAALGFQVSVFVSVKLDRQIDDALSSFERLDLADPYTSALLRRRRLRPRQMP